MTGYSDRENEIFGRASLLLGPAVMKRLSALKVVVFGLGGVGSWCAEALLRSGIKHLTIVDADTVSASNINRQLMATSLNIGKPKTDAMKQRLLEIDPDADIVGINSVYSSETARDFRLDEFDCIIDCIDSLKEKMSLILNATATNAAFYSSMGSALKTDPGKIRTAEFWKVRGCPLAAMLRKKMRQKGTLPSRPFQCVYDEEVLLNRGSAVSPDEDPGLFRKACVNGSVAHITGIFGLTLAGLVINDLYVHSKV